MKCDIGYIDWISYICNNCNAERSTKKIRNLQKEQPKIFIANEVKTRRAIISKNNPSFKNTKPCTHSDMQKVIKIHSNQQDIENRLRRNGELQTQLKTHLGGWVLLYE